MFESLSPRTGNQLTNNIRQANATPKHPGSLPFIPVPEPLCDNPIILRNIAADAGRPDDPTDRKGPIQIHRGGNRVDAQRPHRAHPNKLLKHRITLRRIQATQFFPSSLQPNLGIKTQRLHRAGAHPHGAGGKQPDGGEIGLRGVVPESGVHAAARGLHHPLYKDAPVLQLIICQSSWLNC